VSFSEDDLALQKQAPKVQVKVPVTAVEDLEDEESVVEYSETFEVEKSSPSQQAKLDTTSSSWRSRSVVAGATANVSDWRSRAVVRKRFQSRILS